MKKTYLNHLPPEHAFPALFMQWPETPSLRHSVNMQHFTLLGSFGCSVVSKVESGLDVAFHSPFGQSPLEYQPKSLAQVLVFWQVPGVPCDMVNTFPVWPYTIVWLTLCLQAPPILRARKSGEVLGEDKPSAAKASAAKAMAEENLIVIKEVVVA